jgi:hypothetical protein
MFWWWPSFPSYAHGWSAVLMFAALAGAALGNGLGHNRHGGRSTTHRRWYVFVGAAMLVVGLVYVVTWVTGHQWSYEIFEVEAGEIGLFVVFWVIQSLERWRWTVRPAAAGSARS